MQKAFGVSKLQHKIKRIRSSFHLDEHCLRDGTDEKKSNDQKEMSPVSDFEYQSLLKTPPVIKIDPSTILKQAYKSVTAYGSSTACVCTINGRTLKIANLGDSTCILLRYSADTNNKDKNSSKK